MLLGQVRPGGLDLTGRVDGGAGTACGGAVSRHGRSDRWQS